jgi:hypothetical protein
VTRSRTEDRRSGTPGGGRLPRIYFPSSGRAVTRRPPGPRSDRRAVNYILGQPKTWRGGGRNRHDDVDHARSPLRGHLHTPSFATGTVVGSRHCLSREVAVDDAASVATDGSAPAAGSGRVGPRRVASGSDGASRPARARRESPARRLRFPPGPAGVSTPSAGSGREMHLRTRRRPPSVSCPCAAKRRGETGSRSLAGSP